MRSWSPSPISNTGLAILAFLVHGETPASKEFGPTVQNAMQFLINCLTKKKDKKGNEYVTFRGTDSNEYATLIATYALCEAYGMTRNPNTKLVAEQTLQRIVDNQSPTGGWDYSMVKTSIRDDMSYAGWALQALKAGKMAGLHPKGLDECIKKAIKCLKTRNFDAKHGGFNYIAGGTATGLTATGCLAMQLLGFGVHDANFGDLGTVGDILESSAQATLVLAGAYGEVLTRGANKHWKESWKSLSRKIEVLEVPTR